MRLRRAGLGTPLGNKQKCLACRFLQRIWQMFCECWTPPHTSHLLRFFSRKHTTFPPLFLNGEKHGCLSNINFGMIIFLSGAQFCFLCKIGTWDSDKNEIRYLLNSEGNQNHDGFLMVLFNKIKRTLKKTWLVRVYRGLYYPDILGS